MEDYNKFTELVHMQLRRLNIKKQDYDDYVQEAYMYILNRKKVVDLNDKFIYGDIQNGVLNYARKQSREKGILQTDTQQIDIKTETDNSLIEITEWLSEHEYGYLVMYNKAYGYTVKELSEMFNLTENKIYYEINKILDCSDWVNR